MEKLGRWKERGWGLELDEGEAGVAFGAGAGGGLGIAVARGGGPKVERAEEPFLDGREAEPRVVGKALLERGLQ